MKISRRQFGMALDEVGRVREVVGDVVFGDGIHGVVVVVI